MIFNIISAAAAGNVILGVLALTKGRNRVNLTFFFLSFLLALWNLFVVLWAGAGISVFARLNFIVITFIPLAGVFFVLSLFKPGKGFISLSPYIILAPALGITAYTIGTFFSEPLFLWYDSRGCKTMMFAYELITLFFVIAAIAYNYVKVLFKQEKIKLRYVMAAFVILYAGGMLDLAHGAGVIRTDFEYAGNVCNVVYAGIIFYAIFRVRLFNIDVLFRKFAVYTVIALAAGLVYMGTAVLLSKDRQAMAAVFFIFTLLLVYYAGRMRGIVYDFAGKIGGLPVVEEARRACKRITADQADEDIKIQDTLTLFKKHLEMNAVVYVKGGDYYLATWEAAGSSYKNIIEGSAMPLSIIIRYETRNKKELELLDRFEADIIMPLVYGGDIIGVFAGKKQVSDYSFTQDEVDLVREIASAIAVYMKAKAMQIQQVEDENMKRVGMMSRQMAHEIKNPLAALWGAAQLIEGKSDADWENLVIIKEEMKRLTNILDSWQDFSRDLKLDRRQTDVENVVAEALKLVNLQGHKAEIQFKKPDEKINVSVDGEKIKQVLLNVMLNAIDASAFRNKPLIEIQVIKKKRYADVKVRDNGEGIKKELLVKVKEPMFTSKPNGSGLGLAISERIMKAHGGAILLDSDGETFTEVTLSIPLE
jgi:signal transduction histidine kinase